MSKSFRSRRSVPSNRQNGRILVFRAMQANQSYKTIYQLGDFKVDPLRRKLIDAEGKVVYLTPKTFDVLMVLIESGGRVVTKDELMSTVWHDAIVEEANLVQTISMLRRSLGEKPGENRFIVTVSGQGYRFVTPIEEVLESKVQEKRAAPVTTLTLIEAKDSATNLETGPLVENSKAVGQSINLRKWLIPAIAVCGVALIGVLALKFFARSPGPKRVHEVKSIAVLPFTNIGSKVDEEYLGQGLSEVLITKLSNIKTIVVRPTSAVMKYTDASPDLKRIGSELNVDAIIIGRVQKIDENIRVTAQLVRVSDGATLWAETFDDKLTNIFSLQDSISGRVTESLAVTLSTGEREQITKRFTTDTEAYQLYLQGRYFWNKRSEEGLRRAVEFFTQATGKDPSFARAYSGLADSYMLMGILDLGMNPREAITKAKAAAQKAIALDDTLAEPHTSLAFMAYNYDFDWANADRQFRRAIELNPNYVTAHHWYSQFLNVVKRFDESEAEIKKALQLDPSSLIINADYGTMFYYSRRYDQAVAQYSKTLELEPRFAFAHQELGRAYIFQQRYDEAIAEFNQAIEISGRRPYLLSLLGYAHGMSGRRTETERLLQELEVLGKQRVVLPFNFVTIYLGLNDKKKAMEWMEINFKERHSALIVLGIEPRYDSLRDEPRFQEMLKELKLD